MTRTQNPEAELAATVVAWLEAKGADVYQEVEHGGVVADIVAVLDGETWIVETKEKPCLKVLYQATERRAFAHRVFVAVGHSGRSFLDLCEQLGFGCLSLSSWSSEVIEHGRGSISPSSPITKKLRPEHKTHAKAGTNGGRFTAFRETCEQLAKVVAEQPGITLAAAVDAIKHHYSSAKNARKTLVRRIESGVVPCVELRDGDTARLWPRAANGAG